MPTIQFKIYVSSENKSEMNMLGESHYKYYHDD